MKLDKKLHETIVKSYSQFNRGIFRFPFIEFSNVTNIRPLKFKMLKVDSFQRLLQIWNFRALFKIQAEFNLGDKDYDQRQIWLLIKEVCSISKKLLETKNSKPWVKEDNKANETKEEYQFQQHLYKVPFAFQQSLEFKKAELLLEFLMLNHMYSFQ